MERMRYIRVPKDIKAMEIMSMGFKKMNTKKNLI